MYMPFLTGGYDSYMAYVTNMAENAQWGGQLEAYVLSKGLVRSIRIWRADTNVSLGSQLAYR